MHEFLEESSRVFLMAEERLSGSENTTQERWLYVLEHCEVAHTKPIYSEFTTEFKRAYLEAEGDELRAYTELADLRSEFFERLMSHAVGMAHVNDYEMTNSYLWFSRLSEKWWSLQEGKKGPLKHTWLN